MLLDSFEFNFHLVSNNIKKVTSPTKQMHSNYWKCNHVTKKQQSIDIDARPCNMAWEGNNIFPRSLSVNVKEVSGIFLITLSWANKLAQIYIRSYTYIASRVKRIHHFGPRIAQKRFFTEKPFFMGKYIFHIPLHPLSGSKSWRLPKVKLGEVK